MKKLIIPGFLLLMVTISALALNIGTFIKGNLIKGQIIENSTDEVDLSYVEAMAKGVQVDYDKEYRTEYVVNSTITYSMFSFPEIKKDTLQQTIKQSDKR